MVDFRTFYKDKANVAYIVAGYPNLETTKDFLENLDKSDIDILELGIPYSDPISDGKIISEAALNALANGTNIHSVFELLKKIRTKKALVFLVYYNLIFSYGIKNFIIKAKEVGIKGLIIPELPFEENGELYKECKKANLALIPLISITTPKKRIPLILSRASGFVYAVGSIGITGGKQANKSRLELLVKEIKKYTSLPVFVGFGLKNKEDVQRAKGICDGAIVGTNIVKSFKNGKTKEIYATIKEIF